MKKPFIRFRMLYFIEVGDVSDFLIYPAGQRPTALEWGKRTGLPSLPINGRRRMTQAEKQMNEDRELVERTWALTALCDGSYRFYPRGTVLIQDVHNQWLHFPDWAAARAFTEQRIREVREIEEEIAWVNGVQETVTTIMERIRIAKRLEAIRDNLKRGMK